MAVKGGSRRIPTQVELMEPALNALQALGGRATIKELLKRVIEDLALPQEVTSLLHGKGRLTEVGYRLAWARTRLKNAGMIDNPAMGQWVLTPAGQQRVNSGPSPEPPTGNTANGDQGQQVPQFWRVTLLQTLRGMKPEAFERLCKILLEKSGLTEVCVTGQSGDGGIDGHGVIQLAGLMTVPVLFQCKRITKNVSTGVVREFRGAMHGRADRGMIFTTGGFTGDARQEAIRTSPSIELIDGNQLTERMKELGLGVSTRTVEVVDIDDNWFKSI